MTLTVKDDDLDIQMIHGKVLQTKFLVVQVVQKFLLKRTKQTSYVGGKKVVCEAVKVGYFHGNL